ncbi:unnamed protein product [Prunus armeniaca]
MEYGLSFWRSVEYIGRGAASRILKTAKDIQSLTERVAALTRFISKATDRCAPFFKALKGNKRSIIWTAECDKAFNKLKEYMIWASLLSTPKPGDTFTIYLSVSATSVSSCHAGDPGSIPGNGAKNLLVIFNNNI